jgi:hypothetical protein
MGALLVFCHGVAAASPRRIAEAQEPAARVTQLNREALAAVDKREFEKAREILKKALELCGASGLDRHPVAARTHVHMGVVIIEGFKNRELGEKQFAQALAIEPGIAMTPALVTPEITEAFDEAKEQSKNAGAASAASGGDETAPPGTAARESAARPSSSGGFTYHTVSEVKQGNAIRVTVNVDETLKFRKVVLAYRPQGTSEFLGREMDPIGPGAYSAEIPEHATTGSSVAYYIEAQDDDGQPVANRGTESRPLVIQLAGEARSSERAHASAVTKRSEDERSDDDDSTTIREEGESQDDNSARWFAGVLVGSGVGYATGTGETNASLPVSGSFASTSLGHISPEVGYWVAPDLLISAQGRIQLVTGPTELVDASGRIYPPADVALALFLKASLFFGSESLRPFISGGLGGGQIRHVVTFGAYHDCGATRTQTCVDSVVAGPALAQVGAGFLYKLTSTFGIEASSNVQIAEPKFTFNVDLNAGVAFNF